MGENRRKATYNATSPSLFPRLDIADEVNLASGSYTTSKSYDLIKNVKRLGMERLIYIKKNRFFYIFNVFYISNACMHIVCELLHESSRFQLNN